MKKYLEYKNEILGLKDVFETVQMAEKIAASHIHFLKDEVENLENYIESIEKILSRIIPFYSKKNHFLTAKRNYGKNAIIIISGNKGLVGGLYHNLINSFLNQNQEYQTIVTIGKKSKKYFQEENIEVKKSFISNSDLPQSREIEEITEYIFSLFAKENLKKVDILYPHFISFSEHQPNIIQFLPFAFDINEISKKNDILANENLGFPIFEPSKGLIFKQLLNKYIKVFFYKIMMEAKLSEFSARVITTEQATTKTKQAVQSLRLAYFKERQRNITQKQIESFVAHQII